MSTDLTIPPSFLVISLHGMGNTFKITGEFVPNLDSLNIPEIEVNSEQLKLPTNQ